MRKKRCATTEVPVSDRDVWIAELVQRLAETQSTIADLLTGVEFAPEAIAVHRWGSWVYMNPAGMRLLGAEDPAEIIGRPVLDFVHPGDRASVEEEIRRLEAGEKPTTPSTSKMLRLDRQIVHVEWRVSLASYDGEPAVIVVIRDVTEEAIVRLASFPEMNPNPVLETDEVGHIYYANPTALRVSPNLRDAGLEHPWLRDLQ